MKYTDAVSLCGIDHPQWLKSLSFYKDDLQTIKKRLEEIAVKNTAAEARAGIEHFQNQCIIQQNNIDELSHRIREHEQHVSADAHIHAGKVNDSMKSEHEKLQEDTKQVEKIINELRQSFNSFGSKWM